MMLQQQTNELVRVPDLNVAEQVTKVAIDAGIVPPTLKPATIQAIVAAGLEMGLQPFHALRSLYFVQGRLLMSVQAQLALARRAGVKVVELKDEANSCTVTLARDNEKVTCTYTIEDARRAGLLDKSNSNWAKYPRQMLRWRAIGDALRIIAADVLLGVYDPHEFTDIDHLHNENTDVTQANSASEQSNSNIDYSKMQVVRQRVQLKPGVEPPEDELSEPPIVGLDDDDEDETTNDSATQHSQDELTLAQMNRYSRNVLLRRLHAAAKDRFDSDEARREWLQQNFHKSSFLELTRKQAEEALYLLQIKA